MKTYMYTFIHSFHMFATRTVGCGISHKHVKCSIYIRYTELLQYRYY